MVTENSSYFVLKELLDSTSKRANSRHLSMAIPLEQYAIMGDYTSVKGTKSIGFLMKLGGRRPA